MCKFMCLCKFFSQIAVRTDFTVNNVIKPCMDAVRHADADESNREFIKIFIEWQIKDIEMACGLIQMLSSAYVEVSSKNILPPLTGVVNLALLTKPQDRREALQNLQIQHNTAVADIGKLIQDKHLTCQMEATTVIEEA